jgi:hypothetical protein
MIDLLKTKEFDYTGSNLTEMEAIENGHIQLTGNELLSRISNRTIFGDYPMAYTFVTEIYENGTAKGVNNVGSIDYGNWSIDFKKHTLQLEWENAWINTITRAYDVNGNIEFYDIDTGKWRTTFKIFERRKEE